MVTMVWVVSRFRLKTTPGSSSSCISPLTSLGKRSRAPWVSQPQKSATLSPQPGGKPEKFIRTCGGEEEGEGEGEEGEGGGEEEKEKDEKEKDEKEKEEEEKLLIGVFVLSSSSSSSPNVHIQSQSCDA